MTVAKLDPRPSASSRLAAFLRSPAAPRLALALAIVVGIAAFVVGFHADDWALIAALEHRTRALGTPFDLYRFASGDPAEARSMIERGPWPWWTSPTLRLHLLRPLSSAFFTMDHALFGLAPFGYHVDALIWWLLTMLAAGAVLYRIVPRAAPLALLLFVLDDAHGQPIEWISCRHVLIASAPALLGLAAHLSYRRNGWRPGRWLAPLGLAVGLLGGETALGSAALLFAFELIGPPSQPPPAGDSLKRRLAALGPSAGVTAAYLLAYHYLGGGASDSGSYVEPLSEPMAFLSAIASRLPILIGDLVASVPADFSNVFPRAPFVVAGAFAAVAFTILTMRLWRALEPYERVTLRWLAVGAVLGAAVGLAGYPGSRTLLVPGVASVALVAMLVDRAWLRRDAPMVGRGARVGAAALLFAHGVVAPILLFTMIFGTARMARGTENIERGMQLAPPFPRRIYILASSDPLGPFYASAIAVIRRPGEIHTFEILSMAKRTHRVTRTAATTLTLETVDGTFFDGGFVDVFRARRLGLHAGQTIALEGARVRVLAEQGGAPTAIELVLDVPFEHPSVDLLAWENEGLRPVSLAVGESRDIAWSPGPTGLF
jgi:hypothetical protein